MIFKIASFIVLGALAGILSFAALKPDTFFVQRIANVNADPEKIVPLLEDFHRWSAWSPWEKLDPAMKRTFEGPARGRGAIYAWEGNKEVGQGRMEILEVTPKRVVIKLDFIKPFEAHNQADFILEQKGTYTRVKWTMTGPASYTARVMDVFFSMDRMVGKDFEKGLAELKRVAEQGAEAK